MKLLEVLHTVRSERKLGLVNIDDWRWSDVDYLKSMDFDFDGDYIMTLNKDPHIKIYKKKKNEVEYFIIEAYKKPIRIFRNFEDVVKYFDTYSQPEIDKEKD